jgi:hypothetical protein
VPRWDPAAFLSSLQPPPAAAAPPPPQQQQPAPASGAAPPAPAPPSPALDPLLASRVHGGLAGARSLYARFLSGPHFAPWFGPRRAAVAHLAAPERAPIEAAAAAAVRQPAAAHEVAGVEAFIEAEQQLAARLAALEPGGGGGGKGGEGGPVGGAEADEGVAHLQRRLLSAFWALDSEDLQATLLAGGPRREVLQRAAAAGREGEFEALARLAGGGG